MYVLFFVLRLAKIYPLLLFTSSLENLLRFAKSGLNSRYRVHIESIWWAAFVASLRASGVRANNRSGVGYRDASPFSVDCDWRLLTEFTETDGEFDVYNANHFMWWLTVRGICGWKRSYLHWNVFQFDFWMVNHFLLLIWNKNMNFDSVFWTEWNFNFRIKVHISFLF